MNILRKTMEMLNDNNISFDEFYNFLSQNELGYWDEVNSRDIIEMYINEKINEGIIVSHMLEALEENLNCNVFSVWLGNSMETPYAIETKNELLEALDIELEGVEGKENYITEGIFTWYDLQLKQPFKVAKENLQLAENEDDCIILRFTENYIECYNEDCEKWFLCVIDSNDLFELKILEKAKLTTDVKWVF